jgi:hypothetical protein
MRSRNEEGVGEKEGYNVMEVVEEVRGRGKKRRGR